MNNPVLKEMERINVFNLEQFAKLKFFCSLMKEKGHSGKVILTLSEISREE